MPREARQVKCVSFPADNCFSNKSRRPSPLNGQVFRTCTVDWSTVKGNPVKFPFLSNNNCESLRCFILTLMPISGCFVRYLEGLRLGLRWPLQFSSFFTPPISGSVLLFLLSLHISLNAIKFCPKKRVWRILLCGQQPNLEF